MKPVQEDYCPFEPVADPERFRLAQAMRTTAFGEIFVVRSAVRTSDSVLVLLHGLGGTWSTWTPLLQQAESVDRDLGDIMLVDLPGFGRSQNLAGHLDMETIGREMIKLAKAEGWSVINLVGHSMGGALALDMASRFPRDIASVRTVSGAYFGAIETFQSMGRGTPKNKQAALAYVAMSALFFLGPLAIGALRLLSRSSAFTAFLNRPFFEPTKVPRSVTRGIVESVRPRAFRLAIRNGPGYDPVAQWSRIEAPVWAMFGAGDRLVPPSDEVTLRTCLPSATTCVLDGVGHFAHIERPGPTLAFLFPDQP